MEDELLGLDGQDAEEQDFDRQDAEKLDFDGQDAEKLDFDRQDTEELVFDGQDAEEQDFNRKSSILEFTAAKEYSGTRIDKYLSEIQSEFTRSYLQRLIEENRIFMEGCSVKSNTKVRDGSKIVIQLPELKEAEIMPEDIPLDILYEDKDIIIINKQKGLVVHPAAGHSSGTLVNALLYHCDGELSGINGVLRPGIVHRIDRDTTGVMIACKNDKAHQFIAEQLKIHSITRRYQAIVYHSFKAVSGRIEAPIGRDSRDRKKMAVNYKNGKSAATNYKVLENLQKYAWIECSLETGRTHQIRVHMASIHHPLIGDTVYGPEKDPFHLEGQALHAGVLGFIHPSSKKYVEFQAPLPDYFTGLLEKLRHKG